MDAYRNLYIEHLENTHFSRLVSVYIALYFELLYIFDKQDMWRRLPCFPGAKATILSRIRNIFAEGGLRQDATVAKFATTSTDEITNQDVYYNSAGIISAGYRVKSLWGTRLCI